METFCVTSQSSTESFDSIVKGIGGANGAIEQTQSAFARVSVETAVALSRGVTGAEGQLADLTMQVADQALRSAVTLEQAAGGLVTSLGQLTLARETNLGSEINHQVKGIISIVQ